MIRGTGVLLLVAACLTADAAEWRGGGRLEAQQRVFTQDVADAASTAASLNFEADYEREGAVTLEVRPVATLDQRDARRSRVEFLELAASRRLQGGAGTVAAGLQQIRWGAYDHFSVVDVVNQSDLAFDPYGTRRLGIAALRYRGALGGTGIDVFAASAFRPRVFPGDDGRLRLSLPVSGDEVLVSGAGRSRGEGGLRLDRMFGGLEIAASWFSGYVREPLFRLEVDREVLTPVYDTIEQLGLEARWSAGDWLFRGEAFRRAGQQGGFHGGIAGAERAWFPGATSLILGLDYHYDSRDEAALPGVLEHDLALTGRWLAPRFGDAVLELRLFQDVHVDERLLVLRADRRLGAAWRLAVEALLVSTQGRSGDTLPDRVGELTDPQRKFAFLAREDYLALRIERHF